MRSSNSFSGALYTSGTLTANGNSGWVAFPIGGITSALLHLVPANLAGDETMAIVLALGFDDAGNGEITTVHTFTTVTSTEAVETVVLPGGDSGALLAIANESVGTPLPSHFRLTWTLVGTTKSMDFVLYAALK